MWNPPPALLLVLPLGFVGSRAGGLLWSLLLLASLVTSVRIVWIMHGRPNNPLNLLGYSFAPALVCLLAGQVSIFVLLGLVLFLRLHRSRPFLAGVSLWFCLLKPHLFLPFGIVLLVWAINTRSYKLLAGVAIALGFSTGVVVLWDPLVWLHYGQMMRTISTARMQQEVIPCLSIMLRCCHLRSRLFLLSFPLRLSNVTLYAPFHCSVIFPSPPSYFAPIVLPPLRSATLRSASAALGGLLFFPPFFFIGAPQGSVVG